MRKVDGFDTAAYQERLRLLREIIAGENQSDFAKRLGIPFKRWSNYERGYPVPRETAFLIVSAFPGMSVEWIWWGWDGNLSKEFKAKIATAEAHQEEIAAAQRAVDQAAEKLRLVAAKRKKAIRSSAPRRR
jgi:hypothetical protein